MKLKYFVISILLISLFACKKGDSYDISKMTIFPSFEYESEVVIELGESFTPGAAATEGERTLDVAISGSADVNTVGAYSIVYSATNSDGYDGTAMQVVVVYDPTLTGTNVSGNIRDINRPERTGVISLVEGTNNIYYATDIALGSVFPLYFQMIGDVMDIIPQTFVFDDITEVIGSYDPVARTFHIEIVDYGYTYDFEYYN